jgi:photosystem II stability/assembly factor-like uncharacterized protein
VGPPPRIIAPAPGTFYCVEGADFRRQVYKSSDGGVTWGEIAIAHVQRTSLHADPLAPERLYSIHSFYSGFEIRNDPTLYRSQDGATNWIVLAELPDACSAYDIAVDRTSAAPAVLYFSGARPGGTECRISLWRSPDDGISWTEAAAGLPGAAAELAVDPRDSRVVYAKLVAGPLWRSTNSGASWQVSGLGQRPVDQLAVSPATDALWVSIAGEVFRSTDFGATWQQRGKLAEGVSGFAFDPSDPNRVYAATGRGVQVLQDNP